MNQRRFIKIILIIAVIIIAATAGYFVIQKFKTPPQNSEMKTSSNINDLISFSMEPTATVFASHNTGGAVSGMRKITGKLRGGYFFEGSAPIFVLDNNKNTLLTSYITATTDWMTTGPVSFETIIDFSGLKTGNGYIKITQDDPSGKESGQPIREVLLPIIIGETKAGQEYPNVQSMSDDQIASFELRTHGERCVEGGDNVTDKNHPLVLEAKQTLISNSKISEPYFEKHFSLYCASPYDNHVVFTYKIGDYVTKIADSVDSRGRFYSFRNVFKDLHEIENVISKKDALLKMQACIGGINIATVILEQGQAGLYLQSTFGKGPLGLIGKINLETGVCSKEPLPYER